MEKAIDAKFKEEIKRIKSRKPKMAICYDFDKTLSPDDMQTFTLIPSFGVDVNTFWAESNKLAKENLMDTNLAWMHQLKIYSQSKRLPFARDYFREVGSKVPLFNGVEEWFDRMNKYAESKGIVLEHYIISSGLKEIIEGSSIATKFKRIYASTYLYTADGVAEWPAQAINYTNKTQYIFRIAKGYLEEYDERVNDSMNDSELVIPYENIIYIGDSATDIPCMRLVKSKGGYSIGVFDPNTKNRDKVFQLYNDGRISFFAPADYGYRKELAVFVRHAIDEIAAKEAIKTQEMILKLPAILYKFCKSGEQILGMASSELKPFEKKKMETDIDNIRSLIDQYEE